MLDSDKHKLERQLEEKDEMIQLLLNEKGELRKRVYSLEKKLKRKESNKLEIRRSRGTDTSHMVRDFTKEIE